MWQRRSNWEICDLNTTIVRCHLQLNNLVYAQDVPYVPQGCLMMNRPWVILISWRYPHCQFKPPYNGQIMYGWTIVAEGGISTLCLVRLVFAGHNDDLMCSQWENYCISRPTNAHALHGYFLLGCGTAGEIQWLPYWGSIGRVSMSMKFSADGHYFPLS